jgi:hypothetical protein
MGSAGPARSRRAVRQPLVEQGPGWARK